MKSQIPASKPGGARVWDLNIETSLEVGIWSGEFPEDRGGITREELQRNAAPLTFEFAREP
jgi:hypothetical protein